MTEDKFQDIRPIFKQCAGRCGNVKPIYEFQTFGPHHGYGNLCKVCFRDYYRDYEVKPKDEPGRVAQGQFIEYLADRGIFAAPGKASPWRNIHVVAWGCVKIRVSRSGLYDNYRYSFSPGISHRWQEYDLIALSLAGEDAFYIFDTQDPVFYHVEGKHEYEVGGKLKGDVAYIPRAESRRGSEFNRLDDDKMLEHRNLVSLIERKRLEVVEKLIGAEVHA